VFNKATITRTLAAEEPMVTLDAAAITERIGTLSHPIPAPRPPTSAAQASAAPAPIYRAMASLQPGEAKWRRALRPRPAS
jgi:hypothetical protein